MAGESILIVDDSPTSLALTAHVLREAGYCVETTSEFWIAALVRQLRPRLILMDVNMGPARSGLFAVEGLNGMSVRNQIVIFLYSSQPELELARFAERYKADGYIRKGCSPNHLVRQVAAALAFPETERGGGRSP